MAKGAEDFYEEKLERNSGAHLPELPKIHPRRARCTKAKLEIQQAICDAWERHGITDVEMLGIVNTIAADHIGGFAQGLLREERHGNRDQPADFE